MINEMTKKHDDVVTSQITDSINRSYDELVVKPYKEITKLPEDIFVKVFLPFFSGEETLDSNPDILVRWISIAGNPSKEVQIVDNNSDVIFIVPALMDTSCIDFKNNGKGQALANILANYELHKGQLPVIGQNYLNGTIDNRLKTLIKNSESLSTNEKRWNDIFIRYGKIKDTTVVEESKDRLSDDEIEYD